jgi:hypothetical protein
MSRPRSKSYVHKDHGPMLKLIEARSCQYCGAQIGELCRSKNGHVLWNLGQVHDARLSRNPSKRAISRMYL